MIRYLPGVLATALALHCTHSRPPLVSEAAEWELAEHPLVGYEAHFLITWNGARVGDATEVLRSDGRGGLRFERRERITVRRGDALAHSETQLVIDTDGALAAQRIALRHLANGVIQRGIARRTRHGDWAVIYADEPERRLPGATVPAELVPLLLAANRGRDAARSREHVRFDGPVMLPGYGFATAHLRMTAADSQMLVATLSAPGGVSRSRFFLGQSGTLARIQSDDGTGAFRVDAAQAQAPFAPPEIVHSASVPVDRGTDVPGRDRAAIQALLIEPIPASRPLPPALPGQHIEARGGGWYVRLGPGDTHSPPAVPVPLAEAAPDQALMRLAADIVAASNIAPSPREEAFVLARATADLLEDDLGTPGIGARTALALGRGDCTAHTLLFADLARARGISTRLVTGYRIDGDRLMRHRWAIVAVDGTWIAVDPTFGEAPAAPHLIGLAAHGRNTAELALADDMAFAGLAGARARVCEPRGPSAQPCGLSQARRR